MAKSTVKSAASRVFDDVFVKQTSLKRLSGLKAYLKQEGALFKLVERDATSLERDFSITAAEAQQLLERANGLVKYLQRQFIEQSLHRPPGTTERAASSGVKSMVDGPRYDLLFGTLFDELAQPGALDDLSGVVAYLVFLWSWIRDHIEAYGDDDKKLPIHLRRVDINQLLIDTQAVHKTLSAVEIVVRVLEIFIAEHGGGTDLDEAMIQRRYPNGLPYYRHWDTVNAVAEHFGLSVGHFAHWVNTSYPPFLNPQVRDPDAGRALSHASRLGPYQRRLLTEDPAPATSPDKFYETNFGTKGTGYQILDNVPDLAERTRLTAQGMEQLLALRDYQPVRSKNVHVYPPVMPVESHRSGAVFVNGVATTPIDISFQEKVFKLSVKPATPDPYDRINRKVRLDNWLGLPAHEVDAVLAAAIQAEAKGGTPQHPNWISNHVVHALGLHRLLREGFGCTAAEFAAIIHSLGLYGVGTQPAQFDEVFNSLKGGYKEDLQLDDGEFPVHVLPGATDLTVNQICGALKIEPGIYEVLAQVIARAQGRTDTLLRSAQTFSAFYRLVKLPQLLNMTPANCLVFLQLFGGTAWVNALAGVPKIIGTRLPNDATLDVLDVISALMAFQHWCQSFALEVPWVLAQLADPGLSSVETERERQLFAQISNLLEAGLLSNALFLMAGAPPLIGRDWLDLLPTLCSADGVIMPIEGSEAEVEAFIRGELAKAIKDGLGEEDPDAIAAIVGIMLPVVLQARDAQVAAASQALGVYSGLAPALALLVLRWSGSSVFQLLMLVSDRSAQDARRSRAPGKSFSDSLLTLLADVRRRSAVVTGLGLTAELLQDYLQYGFKAWLGEDDATLFGPSQLYFLSVLAHAIDLASQQADELLDYLRQINEMGDPKDLSQDALRLAQQAAEVRLAVLFNWSPAEVHACALLADPVYQLIRDLNQLALMLRVLELSRHTSMDAATIILLGQLPEDVDPQAYRQTAERVMLSLSEQPGTRIAAAESIDQRLVEWQITLDDSVVVANSGDTRTFTIILKDPVGKALSGVMVQGQARLGTLAIKATNPAGMATVTYTPGSVMGEERVIFTLPNQPKQEAPPVLVTYDTDTVGFPSPLWSTAPTGIVPAGKMVEVSAVAMDKWGNRCPGHLVFWLIKEIDGKPVGETIRPAQDFTNRDGFTQGFFTATDSGTVRVTLHSSSNDLGVDIAEVQFGPPAAK